MSYPPGPRPTGDSAARIVCAVIGGLTVVAVLLVVLLTSTDADGRSSFAPPAHGPVAGGGASSADEGSGSTSGAVATPEKLRDDFPTPPGQTSVDVSESSDGTKVYTLKGSLNVLRSFYRTRLAQLGVTWPGTNPDNYGGRTVGWAGPLTYADGTYVGSLDLSTIGPGPKLLPTGTVTATVDIK